MRQMMVVGYLTLATYTCFMGTFLAVFVPQKCIHTSSDTSRGNT
jgi:hypothetical protein